MKYKRTILQQVVELNASITAITHTMQITKDINKYLQLASQKANLTVKLNSLKAWETNKGKMVRLPQTFSTYKITPKENF